MSAVALPDRILRMAEAARMLGVSRPTLYVWVSRGLLPPPVEVGPRARGFRVSTLEAYLATRRGAAK